MTTKNDQSTVLHYGLKFHLKGEDKNKSYPITDLYGGVPRIFQQILTLYEKGILPVSHRDGESKVFNLSDFRIENDIAYLLITCADKSARDQAKAVVENDKVSDVSINEKRGNEGAASSNHVAISTVPNSKSEYLMLIEQIVGINRSFITSYLNQLLNLCSKHFSDEYLAESSTMETDGGGGIRTVPSRAYVLSFGYIDEDLSKALSKGTMKSVEFIGAHDGDWHVREFERGEYRLIMKLKPWFYEKPLDSILAWSGIARSKNYKRLKLIYKSVDGIQESVNFDIESGLELDTDKFVKKRIIRGFKSLLVEAYVKFNEEVVAKLYELHRDEEDEE